MELTAENILVLVVGIVIGSLITSIKGYFKSKTHNKEIAELKDHMNTHLKITGEGHKKLTDDYEHLKVENENLRISVKTLGQKPGNAEIRLLNIYDSAIRKILLSAPGFSAAWELALSESEREYEESEKGFKSIFNKVLGRSSVNTQSPELKAELLTLENKK